jgi:hypothetical protein
VQHGLPLVHLVLSTIHILTSDQSSDRIRLAKISTVIYCDLTLTTKFFV